MLTFYSTSWASAPGNDMPFHPDLPPCKHFNCTSPDSPPTTPPANCYIPARNISSLSCLSLAPQFYSLCLSHLPRNSSLESLTLPLRILPLSCSRIAPFMAGSIPVRIKSHSPDALFSYTPPDQFFSNIPFRILHT